LKSPKYDTCIKSTDACLYALEDSSCHLCKDGYVLHTNGSCYLIDLKGLNYWFWIFDGLLCFQ